MRLKLKVVVTIIVSIIIGLLIIFFFDKYNKNTLSGELNILVNDSNYEYINSVSEKFMKENPKVNIKINSVKDSNYDKELEKDISKGKTNDIALAYSEKIDELLKEKVDLLDFSDVIKTYKMNFSKRSLQGVYKENSYKGVPFESYPLALYLREDLLKEYGYSFEDIKTWDEVIDMGKDIYKKSDGKIKALNATGSDYKYLEILVFMQNLEKTNDFKKAKEESNKFLEKLIKDNILSLNEETGFVGRINSIDVINEIEDLSVKCKWTTNSAPSTEVSGNRFFVRNGYNIIAFNKDYKKNNLAKEFIIYLTNDTEDSLKYTLKGDIFSSYIYTYRNSDIEKEVKNFYKKSPFVILSNILEKAPELKEIKETK